MTDTIIWVHGDNLNPHSEAFQRAPDAAAIFVWDDALLAEWNISLKRLVFIYECLLELPVVIRRGDVTQVVQQFALEQQASRILTMASPSPRHRLMCQDIAKGMPSGTRLEIMRERAFVQTDAPLDLKRFWRYWNKVKYDALRSTR